MRSPVTRRFNRCDEFVAAIHQGDPVVAESAADIISEVLNAFESQLLVYQRFLEDVTLTSNWSIFMSSHASKVRQVATES